MKNIKIDTSDLEKELRGYVYKYIDELLKENGLIEIIKVQVKQSIRNTVDKMIEKKVYAFLKESEIEVPRGYKYSKKITLNEYIIKIIYDFAIKMAKEKLKGLKLFLDEEPKSNKQLKVEKQ